MSDFIRITDGALDPEFCDHVMALLDHSAHVRPGEFTGGYDPQVKNSLDLCLTDHAELASECAFLSAVTERHLLDYFREHMFLLVGTFHLEVPDPQTGERVKLTPENFAEAGEPHLQALLRRTYRLGPLQAQKYRQGVGGFPAWHSETSPQSGMDDSLSRVLLFMDYLNDVAEGGETEFYYQKRSIAPRKGRMVVAPAHFTHTHRGNVPLSGDKYIVTSWVLFQTHEALYGAAHPVPAA
ncbi:MAG: 2OG-Fe(II) oxygenase superfamily protein [Rhodobacteraceae bacterium HLUCCA24]|nr:MAG: 2OG-Fe(II) oxygenase superfamily protein [Rhodobacteraceae bacterium HLUCCA24]